jgi:hypothetical protein
MFTCPTCGKEWPKDQCPECSSAVRPPRIPSLPPPLLPARKRRMPVVARIALMCVPIFFWFTVIHKPSFLRRPGELAFHKANTEILTYQGTVAFGNTAEAQALALKYSKNLKANQTSFFAHSDAIALSLTDRDFMTYCHLDTSNCVFLVHVPQLRKLDSDSRSSLEDFAWMSAQAVLRTNIAQPPPNLAIGVKGFLSHDTVMIGNYVSEPTHPTGDDGVKTRTGFARELLYPFFASEESTNVPPQNNP